MTCATRVPGHDSQRTPLRSHGQREAAPGFLERRSGDCAVTAAAEQQGWAPRPPVSCYANFQSGGKAEQQAERLDPPPRLYQGRGSPTDPSQLSLLSTHLRSSCQPQCCHPEMLRLTQQSLRFDVYLPLRLGDRGFTHSPGPRLDRGVQHVWTHARNGLTQLPIKEQRCWVGDRVVTASSAQNTQRSTGGRELWFLTAFPPKLNVILNLSTSARR